MTVMTNDGWHLSVVRNFNIYCATDGYYLCSDVIAGKKSQWTLNSYFTEDSYIKRR